MALLFHEQYAPQRGSFPRPRLRARTQVWSTIALHTKTRRVSVATIKACAGCSSLGAEKDTADTARRPYDTRVSVRHVIGYRTQQNVARRARVNSTEYERSHSPRFAHSNDVRFPRQICSLEGNPFVDIRGKTQCGERSCDKPGDEFSVDPHDHVDAILNSFTDDSSDLHEAFPDPSEYPGKLSACQSGKSTSASCVL